MARSNIWRSTRYADKAREVATVTRGISDYFGSAAQDRDYRVTWAPIANTYGGTDVRHKRVVLNPALLDKLSPEAPFSDEAVDIMQGVAAHEAGHAVIASTHGTASDAPTMILNIVEDLMIDRGAFRHFNPGLAVETLALRDFMADHDTDADGKPAGLTATDKFWRENPEVCQPGQLLNVWGVTRLYGARLPDIPNRKHERKYVTLLDVVADGLVSLDDFTGYAAQRARVQAIADINAILAEYKSITPPPPPPPAQPEQGDEDEDGEDSDENGLSSEPSEGEGDEVEQAAAHTPDEYEKDDSDEDDDDEAEGKGSPDESDERINDEDKSGTGDDESDEGDESEGEGEGEGDGDEDADADADSDSDSDADSESDKPSDKPANTKKGGKASKAPTREDWDAMLPDVCPGAHEDKVAADSDTGDQSFWSEVAKELELLDIARPRVTGKVHMARYTDKRTVAAVRQAYAALSNEPTKQRHHDSGRIDRHRIAFATTRDDVFTRQRDKQLTGKVVVILDLSGSTRGYEPLIKSSAASVYEALAKTDLDVWVYGYGNPNVFQMATPKKVFPAFDNINAGGGTPTTQAFAAVLSEVKPRRDESNVIIHITDGVAGDVPSAIDQMSKALKAGWKVINIGIGASGANLPYRKVSSSQQSIEDYTKLPALLNQAVKDIVKGHKAGLSV